MRKTRRASKRVTLEEPDKETFPVLRLDDELARELVDHQRYLVHVAGSYREMVAKRSVLHGFRYCEDDKFVVYVRETDDGWVPSTVVPKETFYA